jgi:hypothetical protein
MPSLNTFHDLAAVQRERGRLRADRDRHSIALGEQWRRIRQPAFRRRVMGDALADLLHSIRPLDHIVSAFGPGRGLGGTLASAILGARTGSPMTKAVIAGLSVMLPALWNGLRHGKRGQHVLSELDRSWQRIKDRLQQHREARRD